MVEWLLGGGQPNLREINEYRAVWEFSDTNDK